MSDLRFLAYDRCDDLARASGDLRVMKHGVEPRIVERTEATAVIEVKCYVLDPSGLADVDEALGRKFDAGPEEVVVEFDS